MTVCAHPGCGRRIRNGGSVRGVCRDHYHSHMCRCRHCATNWLPLDSLVTAMVDAGHADRLMALRDDIAAEIQKRRKVRRKPHGPSWEECAAAGMSAREAAEARGVTITAAYVASGRLGVKFRGTRSELSRERLRKLHQDPEFKADLIQRGVYRFKRLNAEKQSNLLAALTPAERADYDAMRDRGLSRANALRAVGRGDLVTNGFGKATKPVTADAP